jgi:uncharacterized protein (DUF58 family)
MDDMRHVDWKATARSSNLMVREYTAEDDKFVTIVFITQIQQTKKEKLRTLRQKIKDEQNRKELSPSARRFERGVRRIASLISFFEQDGAEIRLVINENDGGFGAGRKHVNKCLKRLALVEPEYTEENLGEHLSSFYENLLSGKPEYIFFVTAIDKQHLSLDIKQRAKVIEF